MIKSFVNKISNRFSGKAISCLFSMFLFFIFPCLTTSSIASDVKLNAIADTNQIRIGEQFRINLSASFSPGTNINFPLLPDTFNHLEIVGRTNIDTANKSDNGKLTLMQQLVLTSFDTGFHVIPPFPFTISDKKGNKDTLYTEAMLMTVRTVVVDTTKDIRAIKNIIEVPFPWQEYLIYLFIIWIVAAIALYIYNKYFRKKKVAAVVAKIPDRAAHEIALEGLRKIEEEKLWQQGLTKKYYSQVTDVIRQYIERRFLMNAMEQTTDEILSYFTHGLTRDDEKEKLGFMLRLADMVKFAKAQPLPSENETTLQYAYSFVENTRPVVKEDFEKKEEVK